MQAFDADADGDVVLHATNENTSAAQASCSTQYTGTSLKADCSKAVMELQANSSAVCRVPNTTVETSDTTDYISNQYQGNKNVALATNVQCQVILGGTVGTSLPCATVAHYANRLNTACGTSNGSTGGVYYPAGVVYYPGSVEPMQDQPPSMYVALSQITGQ